MTDIATKKSPPIWPLLLVTLGLLWLRSQSRCSLIALIGPPNGSTQFFATTPNALCVALTLFPIDQRRSLGIETASLSPDEMQEFRKVTTQDDPDQGKRPIRHGNFDLPRKGSWVVIEAPWWLLGALCLLSPLRKGLRKLRAWRRAKSGLCPNCGYDLRASPDRCPECGEEPKRPARRSKP